MAIKEFAGFGGVTLKANVYGSPDDPSVLLLHSGCQTNEIWAQASEALEQAGRYVISLDMRGHGRSDRPQTAQYDFDYFVEDLRAVLGQLTSRPMIISAPFGGWIATVAIGESDVPLASGLVLVDMPPTIDMSHSKQFREDIKETDNSKNWDPAFLETFNPEDVEARLAKAIPSIRIPTLYVRGAQSEFTKQTDLQSLGSLISNAEFCEIDQAGHDIALDRADVFNALLLDFLERKHPRYPPAYVAGTDSRTLRDALGCFATGVVVVTTFTPEGKPIGLTVNSYTSVSLDPPLILVCIARSSSSVSVLENATSFAINVLHIGQQPISDTFARPSDDRFANLNWKTGDFNAPLISNSITNIECTRHAIHDGGDHIILLGRVERAQYDSRRDPLLYFAGKYRRLHFS